jgi:predicted  nucleic acid-binding Zn-ribbon protein
MKLKNLRKKIRRLEVRLKEGPKKLAKLKRKLEAAAAASAEKARRKLAVRVVEARQTTKPSPSTQKKSRRAAAKRPVKPAGVTKQSAGKKVKKKLNLSPERRAQLSAAMKARWAAKKSVAEVSPQDTSPDRDFALGQDPQTS